MKFSKRGATLEVLNLPFTTGIEEENLRRLINNLILELYKYQAKSEKARIRERQQQGIEITKAKGLYQGRKQNYTEDDLLLKYGFDLYKSKKYTLKEIDKHTRIPISTFKSLFM